MASTNPSPSSAFVNAWWVWIIGIALIWGFIALDLHRARTQAFHHARINLDSLTSIYAEGVHSSLREINYVLIDLREEWKDNPSEFGKLVQSRRHHLDSSIAFSVGIIGTDGKLVFATAAPNASNIDLSDREHFRFHLLTGSDYLHISDLVLLRSSQRLAIQFSRPLPKKNDIFNGVIVASVSPDYFSRFHEAINLGTDSAITLARTNGTLLARFPRPGQAVDTSIEDAPWLWTHSLESGFFQKYSEVDKVERLYAWRVLKGGDLAVIIGQSVKTILASYHQQRTAYFIEGGAVTLLLLLAAFLMRRQQLQRAQATAEMQKMEQALNRSQKLESLGRLTGGVAHDFNNLLQVIDNSIELLDIKGRREEEIKSYLSSIADASKHGKKLVSQLLTFARRQPLHPTIVSPQTLIKNMDGLIQRLAGNGIEVKTRLSDNIWNIQVDPTLFENVILNLVANARDAMNGQGQLNIDVSDAWIEEAQVRQYPGIKAGEYVMLSISDTGCGMPTKVMEQAFEPFFTTKPEGKGTGLGLAAAYGFVKESGGHIYIESAPNEGATIKIFLPRSFEEASLSSLPEVVSTAGAVTILFVEDNPGLREMMGMMLEHQGYQILKAAGSKEAHAILEKGDPIDLLFTDIDMPGGINGIGLAKKARTIYPDLPVLLASGFDDWNDSTEITATVQDFSFLNKPYTAQEAHFMIQKMLAQKEMSF